MVLGARVPGQFIGGAVMMPLLNFGVGRHESGSESMLRRRDFARAIAPRALTVQFVRCCVGTKRDFWGVEEVKMAVYGGIGIVGKIKGPPPRLA